MYIPSLIYFIYNIIIKSNYVILDLLLYDITCICFDSYSACSIDFHTGNLIITMEYEYWVSLVQQLLMWY
jgi:hypothetical protein